MSTTKALARTWACEAPFGPLSQVIYQMSLGGAFLATYSWNYRVMFKTIFLRNSESIVLIWWKLQDTGNFECVPGLLRPPLAVWGLRQCGRLTKSSDAYLRHPNEVILSQNLSGHFKTKPWFCDITILSDKWSFTKRVQVCTKDCD